MKGIIEKDTKIVIILYNDDQVLEINDTTIELISPLREAYADRNTSNSVIIEGLTAPADFECYKYTYDADADPEWAMNPQWLTAEQIAEREAAFEAGEAWTDPRESE